MSSRLRIWSCLVFVGILTTFASQSALYGQVREATPAVVNPALRSALRQTISLDGSWDFAMDPDKKGDDEKWFNPGVALPNKIDIQVPGCWEAQGVGGQGLNNPHFPAEQGGRTIIGCYVGTAWYKKTVTIPNKWKDKEIWLKFGGVNAQGWFWVNGTYLNHLSSYCGSYKYRVTDLVDADGRLVIAAKVRNDVPSGKGLLNYTQDFGGLYRSVELDATPSVSVDYAYVEGDLDKKSVAVNVKVRSTKSDRASVKVQVKISKLDGTFAGQVTKTVSVNGNSTKDVVLNIPLNPFYSWSPEHPNLYRADVSLKVNGREIDGWTERFGVRKWERRGGDFYLNNKKFFVSGYGDDALYPLTLVSPADRDAHLQHLLKVRKFGFNYVRHHTHCELPEFFEAADQAGIMVQPEMPYWGPNYSPYVAPSKQKWYRPKEDLLELITHYRRYVSLSTYCTGNEGHMGSPIDKELYQLAKELDPTRLFLHQDGGHNTPENSDFITGPVSIWSPGAMDGSVPYFAHEYLNLAASKDPRNGWKYFGALLPQSPGQPYLKKLENSGLSVKWGSDVIDGGHYLQRLWQKTGLESARLDPTCDGYIYWTIVDVDGDGRSWAGDQGLLDQFWNIKKTTPGYLYQSNGPTTVLAAHDQRSLDANQRILTEGDAFKVDWWISHFAEMPLKKASLAWSVEAGGRVLGSGKIKNIDANVGDCKKVGVGSFIVKDIDKPVKARLTGTIEGTKFRNSWDLWLFPKFTPKAGAGKGLAASAEVYNAIKDRYPGIVLADQANLDRIDVLITRDMNGTVFEALSKGKSVLLLKMRGTAPGTGLGWWSLQPQGGTAVTDHRAFGDFPHEGYLNELFFRIIGNTVSCAEYRTTDKLMVTDGNQGFLAHAYEAKANEGKILTCGLKLLSNNPEAISLLDEFINYARSEWFKPQGTLDVSAAKQKWKKAAELMKDINGWSETTLKYFQERSYESFLGAQDMDLARFSRGHTEVAWLTQPVGKDLKSDDDFTFKWVAGLGYISQPAAEFELLLGDRKLLKFGVTHDETTWKSADGKVKLEYMPTSIHKSGMDSSGIMVLTLPAEMLDPGKKALLRVVAPQTGSQRWFGLYRYP